MKRSSIKKLFVSGVFLLYLLMPSSASAATPITVTTTADVLAVDGQCSLREAIIAANTDASTGDCQAGSGADTITFSPSLPKPAVFTLTLSGAGEDNAATGDLDLTGTLTIEGAGQDQIILDGDSADRVFDVRPAANITVSGITIRNGDPGQSAEGGGIAIALGAGLTLSNSLVTANTALKGGGIKSLGKLSLSNSTVSSNHGDGILNDHGQATLDNVDVKGNLGGYGVLNTTQGSLSFTGGEVSGNQNGGVYNTVATAVLTNINVLNNTGAGGVANVGSATSRLTMTGSLVKNNSSSTNGAGIRNDGAQNIADIRNTTISSNHATALGGGIFNFGIMALTANTIDNNQARAGGGVDHFGGTLSMTNVTLSGNAASDNGGGLYNRDSATLLNVTFTANTANGLNTGGNLFNDTASISIKNTIMANSDADGNCFNSEGFVTSLGNNLDGGNTCSFTGTGDQINIDPKLGPLQNNGGSTFTHALLTGSPAIDHANNTGCPKTDQRGNSRPADGDANGTAICDIGAFELNGIAPTFTSTATATSTSTPTAQQPPDTFTPTPTSASISTDTPTPTSTETSVATDTPTLTATVPPGSPTPTQTPKPVPTPIPPCSSAALFLAAIALLMRLRVAR